MGDATALTPMDGRGDGDGLGDLPSASGSAVDEFSESADSSSKTSYRGEVVEVRHDCPFSQD